MPPAAYRGKYLHIAKCAFVLVNTTLFAGSAAVLLNAVQLSYIGRGGSCTTVLMLLPLVAQWFENQLHIVIFSPDADYEYVTQSPGSIPQRLSACLRTVWLYSCGIDNQSWCMTWDPVWGQLSEISFPTRVLSTRRDVAMATTLCWCIVLLAGGPTAILAFACVTLGLRYLDAPYTEQHKFGKFCAHGPKKNWFLELPSWWQYPYVAQLCIGFTLMAVLVPSLACTHRYLCHILIWPTMIYRAESKSRPDRSQCDVNTLVMLPWACVDAALFVVTACRFTVAFNLGSSPWGLMAISKVALALALLVELLLRSTKPIKSSSSKQTPVDVICSAAKEIRRAAYIAVPPLARLDAYCLQAQYSLRHLCGLPASPTDGTSREGAWSKTIAITAVVRGLSNTVLKVVSTFLQSSVGRRMLSGLTTSLRLVWVVVTTALLSAASAALPHILRQESITALQHAAKNIYNSMCSILQQCPQFMPALKHCCSKGLLQLKAFILQTNIWISRLCQATLSVTNMGWWPNHLQGEKHQRISPWFSQRATIEKHEVLGSNLHCKVYSGCLITNIGEHIKVALKTFPRGATMNAVQCQVQLLQEACRRSRHLCRVHGVTTLDQRPCVVLELYPHNLAAELMSLPGQRMPIATLVRHGCNICRGLHQLHSSGITMEDLKPVNVLIREDGVAVLADFGLMKAAQSDASWPISPAGVGISSYRAPETICSITNSTDLTPAGKADMWSLGCMLLEMYMGSTWPSAAEAAKLFSAGPYSGPLPAALADIIKQCLDTDSALRPTASEVKQVLKRLPPSAAI